MRVAAGLASVVCLWAFLSFPAEAQQTSAATIPRVVRLTGTFLPADGQPAASVETVTLSIYADEAGGSPMWEETQDVRVDSVGQYTLLLGASRPEGLPPSLFVSGEARWLAVRFERPGESDRPRTRLTSVPYALRAADAETLGGRPASAYALAKTTEGTGGTTTVAGPTAVNPGTPNFLSKYVSTADVGNSAVYETNGSVGIGTTVPLDTLHVRFSNTSGVFTGFAVQNLGATALSFSGMLFYDQNGALGQFQGFNNSTHEYRINNVASSGTINFMTSSTSRFFVASAGSIGIGTTTPADRLQVVGDVRVGTGGANGCLKNFAGTGLVGVCTSDGRLKRDIAPFGPALSAVALLQPVHYYWRATEFPERQFGGTRAYGLIAQDVEQVLPELVVTNDDGYKAVDYSKLPLLTIQAIKELKAENDGMQRTIADLQKELRAAIDASDVLRARLAAEQGRWTDLNQRMEALEQSLVRR
jgi:hypothetical protein